MTLCIAHGGDLSEPSGGTDRVTALAAGLDERGLDVILMVPEPAGEFPPRLDAVDVRPVAVDRYGVGNALVTAGTVAKRALDVASTEGARLQFEHSTLAGVATLLGASGYVLDVHDLAFARFDHVDSTAAPVIKRGVSWLERRAFGRADRIVAVSERMRSTLDERWGIPAGAVSVVPNGYFPERIAPVRDVDPVAGRVSFLGTLHPKVDVDALVALAESPAVTELVVIGDGDRRDRLERLAADLPALEVTGRLPDEAAFRYVASSEAVVNPQIPSPLQRASSPVKLYYYAALGKPIVAAPGPDVVATLVDADAALIADSSAAVRECVERFLRDEDLAARLAANARDLSANFMWRHRVDTLADLNAGSDTDFAPGRNDE